jgi:hypothetical protein
VERVVERIDAMIDNILDEDKAAGMDVDLAVIRHTGASGRDRRRSADGSRLDNVPDGFLAPWRDVRGDVRGGGCK